MNVSGVPNTNNQEMPLPQVNVKGKRQPPSSDGVKKRGDSLILAAKITAIVAAVLALLATTLLVVGSALANPIIFGIGAVVATVATIMFLFSITVAIAKGKGAFTFRDDPFFYDPYGPYVPTVILTPNYRGDWGNRVNVVGGIPPYGGNQFGRRRSL